MTGAGPTDEGPGLTIREEDDGRLLVLTGELDLATVAVLESALSALGGNSRDVTLDLAGLAFMDSSGIKLIINAARDLEGRGFVTLRSPSAPILRVLELVQIDRLPNVKVEIED
jgi:anti-sigma B factor antagonist